MANRFQSKQYESIYPFLAQKHGEYCLACYIEKGYKRGPGSVKIEIDHADGNKNNWAPSNLYLLCKIHNIKMRSLSPAAHIALLAGYSAKNENERTRLNLHKGITKLTGAYQRGSPEMLVNSYAESNWLDWMHSMIDSNGSISKEDAVNAGAIAADDVDIQTTGRYYKKHTSILGRFKETRVENVKCVTYREPALKVLNNGRNGHHNGTKNGSNGNLGRILKEAEVVAQQPNQD